MHFLNLLSIVIFMATRMLSYPITHYHYHYHFLPLHIISLFSTISLSLSLLIPNHSHSKSPHSNYSIDVISKLFYFTMRKNLKKEKHAKYSQHLSISHKLSPPSSPPNSLYPSLPSTIISPTCSLIKY